MSSERVPKDPRQESHTEGDTGVVSASETEPEAESSGECGDGDWGPGRCPLPLTSQAEAKPPGPEEEMADEDEDRQDGETQRSLDEEREWRIEQAAQRADYSGISDGPAENSQLSASYFDYEELDEQVEQEESPDDATAGPSTEHQPGSKRSRPDDAWWQALNRDIAAVGKDKGQGAGASRKGDRPEAVSGGRIRLSKGITVDSGAADNVMPRRMLRGTSKVRPSPASRAGVHYVVANDGRIPNEGEADFRFQTKDGQQISWLFQIAEVNKTLASVSSLVDSGHVVTFDKDATTGVDTSFITNKNTGKSMKMRRERNVWVIDAYLADDMDKNADSLFSRQE